MLLTFFIAQLFGFMFLTISVSMAFQKGRMLDMIDDLLGDKTLLFIVGTINLAAGLLVVLSHNVWMGDVLLPAVTLLGWFLVLRGIALLWMPSYALKKLYNYLNLKRHYYTFTAFVFIIGLYFTFAGFGWLV